jgi:16S rRNA processing protein RimM
LKQKLIIGIIRTSHGINGELKVKSLSGETEHFKKLKDIYTNKKGTLIRFQVEKIRILQDTIVLKLNGIDSPEQGKEYCGSEIWVDRAYACPLENGEYYYGDMLDSTVIRDNTNIGKVISIFESGTTHILEISDAESRTIMIPFTVEYISEVNIEEGKIVLKKEAELIDDFADHR